MLEGRRRRVRNHPDKGPRLEILAILPSEPETQGYRASVGVYVAGMSHLEEAPFP